MPSKIRLATEAEIDAAEATVATIPAVVAAAVAADGTVAAAAGAAVGTAVAGLRLVTESTLGPLAPDGGLSITDSAGHKAVLEIGPDGHLTPYSVSHMAADLSAPITTQINTAAAALPVPQTITEGPGYSLVLVDSAGHKSELQLDLAGRFVGPFIDRISTIAGAAATVAVQSVVQTATAPVASWGDSMTGPGSGYSDLLAAELNNGVSVLNYGIGGQSTQQIAARQGGFPALCTVPGNTIPASGPLTFTSITPGLYTTSSATGVASGHGTLAGVPGTISRTYPSASYVFTRDTSGAAVWCPEGTPFTPDAAIAARGRITVFWPGRNSVDDTSAADLMYLNEMMVRHLNTAEKRFLFLEVTPQTSEVNNPAPTTMRTAVDTYNALLWKTFPHNVVPVSSYMRERALADAGITPTSADTTNIANGVVPDSLMADDTHFNLTGRTMVARLVANTLKAKGWVPA